MSKNLGEREIIRILTSIFGKRSRFPLGFNDDVAAFPSGKKSWIVLKSDMLVGSTDVPREMGLRQAARKAVVATVSDFAAKGVRPKVLMVSLGLPSSIGRRDVRDIGLGLERGAREYRCRIIGGDTNKSDDLVIDCIGAGEVDPRKLVMRRGARPGDVVAVTGKFGNAAAGLRLLHSRKKRFSPGDRALVDAVLLPKARLDEGLGLAQSGAVTSSIDSSDGLAWSLYELARASKVGISLNSVPVTEDAERFGDANRISPIDLALYGGEEYELVATVRQETFETVRRKVPSLIPIGRVHRGPPVVRAQIDGRGFDVEPRGWEHFKKQSAH